MIVTVKKSKLSGKVKAPPSKSYAHRLLIAAALSKGVSLIRSVAQSEDILATADCLNALGSSVTFSSSSAKVVGSAISGDRVFNCRESGSTLRFLIPVSLLGGGGEFVGTAKLLSRGVGVYKDLFEDRGIKIVQDERSIKVEGNLKSGVYSLRGDVSSQFVSGLLFALPLVDGDSEIVVEGKFESRFYVDMTLDVLKKCSVEVLKKGENRFFIKGNQTYSPVNGEVEGDWSNGAFFFAMSALGGRVEVEGLDENSKQGDKVALRYIKALSSPSVFERGEVLDLSDAVDLAPILFTVAAALYGGRFKGTRRLSIKESDRAKAMKEELEKFGAKIEVFEDEVIVYPTPLREPTEVLSAHNDHRVVMSLAVLSALFGGRIEGAEAVRKSFPDFFQIAQSLGMEIEYEE